MSKETLESWLRGNAVFVTVLAAYAIATIWWGSRLETRVGYIETYGSPQTTLLTSRIAALEVGKADQKRLLVHVEEMVNRIGLLESRIARVEDRQQSVLEVLKANGAKIDAIAESIQKHMQETGRNNR